MSEECNSEDRLTISGAGQCENRDSCEKTVCDRERRNLLRMTALGGSMALAGCTGLFATPSDPTEPRADEQFDVDYVAQDEQLQVRQSQTLLGAGLDANLDLPYQCKAGFCGVCLAQTDGDASDRVNMRMNDVDMLNEEAIEAGYFLPCTSNPRSDLDLDTDASVADLREFQDEDEEDDEDDVPGVPTHAVDYVNQQWTVEVPEDENLLVAGEERGFDLPFECREGFCGVCLAQADGDASELVEMTTNDYDPLDEAAMEEGYLLTCTGQPRDEFELETGKHGDLE